MIMLTQHNIKRMLPLDVANQFFIDKTGEPMTQQEQAMFNEVYHEIEKENRQ